MTARMVVLISGSGSNLQAVLDACADGTIDGDVVCVISDRKNAYGITRAERAGVPARWVSARPFRDDAAADRGRGRYDQHLAEVIEELRPDLVVLAGFMRILSPSFVEQFMGRLINLHPALPGEFPGTHAIERALHAARSGEISRTGVMIHHVIAEVDAGPVIATREVPIHGDDDLEALTARVHAVEHRLLVEAICTLITGGAASSTST